MSWDSTGPQAGYFPFYLSAILAAACLFGIGKEFLARKQASATFVTRAQLRRVTQVFVPTLLFCAVTQRSEERRVGEASREGGVTARAGQRLARRTESA